MFSIIPSNVLYFLGTARNTLVSSICKRSSPLKIGTIQKIDDFQIRLEEDKQYIYVVALEEIYSFLVDDLFHLKSLSKNYVLNSLILKFKIFE